MSATSVAAASGAVPDTWTQILGHGRLGDLDAELQEFVVDPRSAPQWVAALAIQLLDKDEREAVIAAISEETRNQQQDEQQTEVWLVKTSYAAVTLVNGPSAG